MLLCKLTLQLGMRKSWEMIVKNDPDVVHGSDFQRRAMIEKSLDPSTTNA